MLYVSPLGFNRPFTVPQVLRKGTQVEDDEEEEDEEEPIPVLTS